MKGVFIFLGLVLLVITIVAVVIINKDSPIDPIVLDPIDEPVETQDEPNPEQTTQPEKQIDLDMNNLEAECDSPTIKCSTEGCVTQC